MLHTTNVNIRMDEDLKRQADQLFNELGMTMTTAINIFVRQAVNRGGIPFEIHRKDDFYNDDNQYILQRSVDQLNACRGISHELIVADHD